MNSDYVFNFVNWAKHGNIRTLFPYVGGNRSFGALAAKTAGITTVADDCLPRSGYCLRLRRFDRIDRRFAASVSGGVRYRLSVSPFRYLAALEKLIRHMLARKQSIYDIFCTGSLNGNCCTNLS